MKARSAQDITASPDITLRECQIEGFLIIFGYQKKRGVGLGGNIFNHSGPSRTCSPTSRILGPLPSPLSTALHHSRTKPVQQLPLTAQRSTALTGTAVLCSQMAGSHAEDTSKQDPRAPCHQKSVGKRSQEAMVVGTPCNHPVLPCLSAYEDFVPTCDKTG